MLKCKAGVNLSLGKSRVVYSVIRGFDKSWHGKLGSLWHRDKWDHKWGGEDILVISSTILVMFSVIRGLHLSVLLTIADKASS